MFKEVTRADAGTYTCVASNNQGVINKTISVAVVGESTIQLSNKHMFDDIIWNILFIAPRIKIDSKLIYFGAEVGRNVAHVSKIRSKVTKLTIIVWY